MAITTNASSSGLCNHISSFSALQQAMEQREVLYKKMKYVCLLLLWLTG